MINEDKMTCAEVRALLGGSPPGEADARVGAHLAGCPDCRAWAEEDAALREKLRDAQTELPDDLHDTIMARVRAEKSAARRRSAGIARRFTLGFAAAFVLFAVLTAVLALPLLRGGTGGPEREPLIPTAGSRTLPDSDAPQGPEHPEDNRSSDEEAALADELSPTLPESAGEGSAAEELSAASAGTQCDLPDGGDESAEKDPAVKSQENDRENESTHAENGASVSERITRILLILSGLFALASFIAFLISLSAVRRRPEQDSGKK